MTAVAPPPSLQPLPRLGWTSSGNSTQGGLDSIGSAEVSRIFARKSPQRTDSSNSIASSFSHNSSASTSTAVNSKDLKSRQSRTQGADWAPTGGPQNWASQTNQDSGTSLINLSVDNPNGRPPAGPPPGPVPMAQPPTTNLHQAAPVVPSQKNLQSQQQVNGPRMAPPPTNASDPSAILVLLPMNGTFERKQITVPLFPEMLRIGRQTNAKTVPTPTNGYFDSKVLSRQHAEIWADRNGKIWIRDVKSSNGTFVNGMRLSPESRESEPHELRENDSLELGIDIVSEDQKSIVHHKVSAKVEHAGLSTSAASVLDLNIGDIDPGSGGVMGPMYPQIPMRGRGNSQGTVMSNGRMSNHVPAGINGMGVQRHMNAWLAPISIEQLVKRLGSELKQAKQQSSELNRTTDFFNEVLTTEPGKAPPKPPASILPQQNQPNGTSSPHKGDPMSPFSGPPAPPPQQPLPEKPDSARSGNIDASILNAIRRVDPDKSHSASLMPSPTRTDAASSQIMSLAEALASTRKELENQGNRVRFLEESLKQEQRARETAEERARYLLERSKAVESDRTVEGTINSSHSDISSVISTTASASDTEIASDSDSESSEATLNPYESSLSDNSALGTKDAETSALLLQERLNLVLREMDEMRGQTEMYKQKAEEAEQERNSLADMVERIRQEQQESEVAQTQSIDEPTVNLDPAVRGAFQNGYAGSHLRREASSRSQSKEPNGAITDSAKQMQQLQSAMAQAFAISRDDSLARAAPYASMLSVVLIGVGLMTYLNGWPKGEN